MSRRNTFFSSTWLPECVHNPNRQRQCRADCLIDIEPLTVTPVSPTACQIKTWQLISPHKESATHLLKLCTHGRQYVHNKRWQRHSNCLQVMRCGGPGRGDGDVQCPKQQCDTDREFHSHRIHAAYLPENLKRYPTLDTLLLLTCEYLVLSKPRPSLPSTPLQPKTLYFKPEG